MKQYLEIYRLNPDEYHDVGDVTELLDSLPKNAVNNNSWPEYPTPCTTSFVMMYARQTLWLKFYVKNDFFGSVEWELNGPVHKDNCVEFFVAFNNEAAYYNIEFNCLSIGKAAFGTKAKREFLSKQYVELIQTKATADKLEGIFDWEMTLQIPAEFFEYHDLAFDDTLQCRANFYKCGDDLPQPHFLTWNRIKAVKPDFHRPEFFKEIRFSGIDIKEKIKTTGTIIYNNINASVL